MEVFTMTKKILTVILAVGMLVSLLAVTAVGSYASDGITEAEGWLESAYAEWTSISGADGYNVYVAASGSSSWSRIDDMLIRKYPTYWRADALGLKAGKYQMKIVPIKDGAENTAAALLTAELTVKAHDRSGFAFVNGTSSGAYGEDGTLKSGARVVYITNDNKDTVSLKMTVNKSGESEIVGVQNIISALNKGYEKSPLCIRFIGNISDPAVLDKGDLLVDFGGKFSGGVTIEGVGEDAVFNGFGIRIKNTSNLEIRNLAFMNCDSNEGDSVSLQQDNDHIWVHNCDLFYGMSGTDADQLKGDGALDTKKSSFITHSYNHFWDAGKSCLLGNTGEVEENYITYHHNWFDHSDSRHPRVRTASVHVYNNFYDGISKYGIGATSGASIFAEANYFLNSRNPMLASMQGSDIKNGQGTFSGEDGGIIKAYGNAFINSGKVVDYSESNTGFDVYTVANKKDTVPASVTTKQGGHDYNNFDTGAIMYSYEAQSAEDAMSTVKTYAGRMNGGDFEWSFKSGSESSYSVDTELKNAINSYESSIVSIGGSSMPDQGGNEGGTTPNPDQGGNEGGTTPNPDQGGNENTTPDTAQAHSFTKDDKTDPEGFFVITGNTSTAKGSVSYGGTDLTKCLKMESSTNIAFTTAGDGKLVLVFGGTANASGKTVKINGTKKTIPDSQILELELEAGTHAVTKGDAINLFYIAYIPEASDTPEPPHEHSFTNGKCECGELDPSYTPEPPHEHSFTDGKCECGEVDPSYTPEPPHEHSFTNGKCECGEVDPSYTPDTPDEPDTPEPDGNTEPERLNFFQRIWRAILNFFAKIFGKK